ncbi:MAG: hypothetical protein EOO61_20165, partial [Hymenobacter sp.]
MRTTLPKILLLLAGAAYGSPALAQTPTLEFTTGANNPTGNGPVTTNQVITLQNNTDNPTGSNNFVSYSPTTTVTFTLSGQQYPADMAGTNRGVMFGGASSANNNSATPDAYALFPTVGAISGSAPTQYTSTNGVTGGISLTANNAVELFTDGEYISSNNTAGTRYRYATLTLTFSQPMVNPVLHITGLGTNNGGIGYTSELDLLTTGVTFSKLSGSTELNVTSTQILNSAANPTFSTGGGAASGSVLVTTP